MQITQTYRFFFEIDGSTYNFTFEDTSLDNAKDKLKKNLAAMLQELGNKKKTRSISSVDRAAAL